MTLSGLINDLSQKIVTAQAKLAQSERNKEWTKMVLTMPLLEGLGWDKSMDISYVSSPDNIEGGLDFVLKCQCPIGVEVKPLDVDTPREPSHQQVEKGLKKSKERGASYFIWTNGDCWQFYSIALDGAPLYEVFLSRVADESEKAESVASKLSIIEKSDLDKNPEKFDKVILDNWRLSSLPEAWSSLLEQDTSTLFQLVRNYLHEKLDIKDDEILEFLKTLAPRGVVPPPPKTGLEERKYTSPKKHSFPEDWKKLLYSDEPVYEDARKLFKEDNSRKLVTYISSKNNDQLSKSIIESGKLAPAVSIFREWYFIKKNKDTDKYVVVKEGVPYLERLIKRYPIDLAHRPSMPVK